MIKIIYRYFFAPLAVLLYLSVIVPLFAKPRKLFALRGARKRQRPNSQSVGWIWVHASSGEFEYAKAIIRELKSRQPELKVLVTYSSPSYEAQIRNFKLVDHSEPLPLDIPAPMSELIRRFRPAALLIARTDLWPEVLWQCQRYKVKTLLFALAFPKPLGFIERAWKAWIIDQVDHVFVISKNDAAVAQNNLRLKTMMDVVGDPRFDQAMYRISNDSPLDANRFDLATKDKLVLVAGSTWPDDEAVLLPALKDLLGAGKLRLIIAPHDPSDAHLQSIEKQFPETHILVERFSKSSGPLPDVLVIDRVGVLANLYPYGDVAFVGGSFKAKVHSVMEALVAGCPVIVGPKFQNNAEAVKYLDFGISGKVMAVKSLSTSGDIKAYLQDIAASHVDIKQLKNHLHETTKTELGASHRIVDRMLSAGYLENSHESV